MPCTYEVQDPAHGAVASAGQNSEIRNVSEEVEPVENKHGRSARQNSHSLCILLFIRYLKAVCLHTEMLYACFKCSAEQFNVPFFIVMLKLAHATLLETNRGAFWCFGFLFSDTSTAFQRVIFYFTLIYFQFEDFTLKKHPSVFLSFLNYFFLLILTTTNIIIKYHNV